MKVFGFYREDAPGVDLAFSTLLPKPIEYILLGERVLSFSKISGYIYGYKGVILRYGDLETGPIFYSDSGFFSDSIGALYLVGVPPDYEKCKEFIEKGDFEGFTPLKYTKRIGGKVRIRFEGGLKFEVLGEGGIEIFEGEIRRFEVLPQIYGKLWFLKLALMKGEKRKRALTVERWFQTHSS
jgi:hypothetical protein